MSDSVGGPWTSHGHAIPGVTVAGGRPTSIARCGGPRICGQCGREAAHISSQATDVVKIRVWPTNQTVRVIEIPTTKE